MFKVMGGVSVMLNVMGGGMRGVSHMLNLMGGGEGILINTNICLQTLIELCPKY